MRWRRRIATGVATLWLRAVRPKRMSRKRVAREEFSTHPGGKGLRMNERLRDRLRRRWLRLTK